MNQEKSGIRINKYLSAYGVCSRREADRLIGEGQVMIGERPAKMGDQVFSDTPVFVSGKPVGKKDAKVLLLFHKPRGVVCTSSKREGKNIIDYIHYPTRIYPVGRLDQDSEGLILLTNYGPLAHWMTHPSFAHEKEYLVRVDKPVTAGFLKRMEGGVPILGTVTQPCRIWKKGEREFSITLTQGMNRQIRRMCEYLGYRVVRLRRVRVMDLLLGDLPLGQYREATKKEWAALTKQMQQEAGKTGGNYGRGEAAKTKGTGTKAKRGK